MNNNAGHRQRLRKRYLDSGLDGFLDYEVIELLLTLGTPRRDCKQQAKEAINFFGSLKSVLDSTKEELQQVSGLGSKNTIGISLFKELSNRYSKEKLVISQTLKSPEDIFGYLKNKIGNEKKEHFAILFFNTHNQLIYSNISIGTINASLVHPREVFNQAIMHNSSHIVVAHNHPSSDPEPSDEDMSTTRRLVMAGKIIGITIVDHIIIARDNYVSLKERGMLNG